MSNTELDENNKVIRSFTLTDYPSIKEMFADPENILIMHNGLSFDGPAADYIFNQDTEPFEVKAEIIDTLILSWYLYPKNVKHGLAWWGEFLGISKPVIDNWETLTLDEYIHRCKEDVRIQVALWRQIWKHFMLLYGNEADCWRAIRHFNFKAKCAAMQEDSKWKLDVPETQKLSKLFGEKYEEARVALEARMPRVPIMKKKSRPAKPFKASGEMSAHGVKWGAFCKIHDIDFDSKVEHPY